VTMRRNLMPLRIKYITSQTILAPRGFAISKDNSRAGMRLGAISSMRL